MLSMLENMCTWICILWKESCKVCKSVQIYKNHSKYADKQKQICTKIKWQKKARKYANLNFFRSIQEIIDILRISDLFQDKSWSWCLNLRCPFPCKLSWRTLFLKKAFWDILFSQLFLKNHGSGMPDRLWGRETFQCKSWQIKISEDHSCQVFAISRARYVIPGSLI